MIFFLLDRHPHVLPNTFWKPHTWPLFKIGNLNFLKSNPKFCFHTKKHFKFFKKKLMCNKFEKWLKFQPFQGSLKETPLTKYEQKPQTLHSGYY